MKVSLVGAGPGDPGLFTLRGKELLQEANVVVYDALINKALLKYAPKDADLIYVGKIGSNHALPQTEINALLASLAQEKGKVVRLKGGDPYIFGRGGEEAEYLAERGIPFEEVPGISSAIAAPAYAGIPLSHRDFCSAISIITGHENPEKESSALDWEALARSQATLVFVMGMKNLPNIAARLIEAGLSPDTAAALIYRGTSPMQRNLFAPLAKLPEEALKANFTNPSVIVVGKVVSLHEKLDWLKNKTLLGRRIVVTRAREQASEISRLLSQAGAEVLEFPSITIQALEDYSALDKALAELSSYAWLIFTSVNGVHYFWHHLTLSSKDSRSLGGVKLAAIGSATAEALRKHGIEPDLVPPTYVAEKVAEAILEIEGPRLQGQRILLPRALEARMVLPEMLTNAGAIVDIIPIYKTVAEKNVSPEILDLLSAGKVDCVSFGSSSTVRNFLSLVPKELLQGNRAPALAAIGPITAATLADYGLRATIKAQQYDIPGMVQAIETYFSRK